MGGGERPLGRQTGWLDRSPSCIPCWAAEMQQEEQEFDWGPPGSVGQAGCGERSQGWEKAALWNRQGKQAESGAGTGLVAWRGWDVEAEMQGRPSQGGEEAGSSSCW